MVGLNGTWSDFVQFLHKFDATQCHALMNFEKTNSICYCCGGTLQNPIVALCEDKFSPVGPFSSLHRNPFLFLHVIVNVSQNRCAGHSITVGPVCPWTTLFTSVTAILHSQHRSVRKRPNLKKKIKNLLLWKLLPFVLFCLEDLVGLCLCHSVTHCSNGRQCPPDADSQSCIWSHIVHSTANAEQALLPHIYSVAVSFEMLFAIKIFLSWHCLALLMCFSRWEQNQKRRASHQTCFWMWFRVCLSSDMWPSQRDTLSGQRS